MKILICCLTWIGTCTSLLKAGDYFPYKANEITYAIASPFTGAHQPQLPPATLTIQFDQNQTYGLRQGKITALTIVLGKDRFVVDQAIIQKMGRVDIGKIDFYWVDGAFYFVAPVPDAPQTPLFRIKDRKIENLR